MTKTSIFLVRDALLVFPQSLDNFYFKNRHFFHKKQNWELSLVCESFQKHDR